MNDDRKTVVLIGDVHAEWERLQRTLGSLACVDPDLVLLTGDIGRDPPWQRAQRRAGRRAHDESVRRVLAQVREPNLGREVRCKPASAADS